MASSDPVRASAGGGPQESAALISLSNIIKTYETPTGPFSALNGISLEVCRGEFVAVMGKSGSGKSTLLNMITGIDTPTCGEIQVASTAVHTLNQEQLSAWRGKNVGVVFQFFQLLPTLTIVENVMLPMDFCRTYPPRKRRDRAMELLEKVGIPEQAGKLPSALSGGQQQLAAIARALANDPPVLAADEPTGNLDSQTSDRVMRLFEQLSGEGRTVVMVTHERDMSRYFTRSIVLSDGSILAKPAGNAEVMAL